MKRESRQNKFCWRSYCHCHYIMILSCYQMWKRPWNCIYYLLALKEVYDNLIKKYFFVILGRGKMWICEMKKQMEILILLLLNMITTAFSNDVASIKVLKDYITITKPPLFQLHQFCCAFTLLKLMFVYRRHFEMCSYHQPFLHLKNASC